MTARITFLLLAALVLCAMAVVASQHKARKLFIAFEQEQERTRALEVEFGQLQLEQSTWAMHGRIEKIASYRLRMRSPDSKRIQLVPPPEATR